MPCLLDGITLNAGSVSYHGIPGSLGRVWQQDGFWGKESHDSEIESPCVAEQKPSQGVSKLDKHDSREAPMGASGGKMGLQKTPHILNSLSPIEGSTNMFRVTTSRKAVRQKEQYYHREVLRHDDERILNENNECTK